MRVVGLVVARGGSKGLPGKNLRPLGGHPLVGWAVRAGVMSARVEEVVISTDDAAIAGEAKRYGVGHVIDRPAALACDTAVALDVVRHAAAWLDEQGVSWDALALLQPTCPLRLPADVDEAIQALADHGDADSACTLSRVDDAHPARLRRIVEGYATQFLEQGGDHEGLQRQDHQPAYRRNGAVYVTRRATLERHASLYGPRVRACVMPDHRSVNIDTEVDLLQAQAIFQSDTYAQDAIAWRAMMADAMDGRRGVSSLRGRRAGDGS